MKKEEEKSGTIEGRRSEGKVKSEVQKGGKREDRDSFAPPPTGTLSKTTAGSRDAFTRERKSKTSQVVPSIALDICKTIKLSELSTQTTIKKRWEDGATSILDINAEFPPTIELCDISDSFKIPSAPVIPLGTISSLGVEDPLMITLHRVDDEFEIRRDEPSTSTSTSKRLPRIEPEDSRSVRLAELLDVTEILPPNFESVTEERVAEAQSAKLEEDRKLEQLLERAQIDLFRTLRGSGSLMDGGAIIVLARERDERRSCCDLLQEVCRRLGRERGHSTHNPRIVKSPEEMERCNVYDYFVFVFENAKPEGIVEKKIKEFKRGCPAYLILETPLEKAEGVYSQILRIKDRFFDNVLLLKLVDLNLETFRYELAPILFGYLTPKVGESVDEILGEASWLYYDKLRSIGEEVKKKPDAYPVVRTSVLGNESDEHNLIKHFVVKCLVDGEFSKEDVETEVQLGSVVPDVYVRSKGLAIEVETLFGKGSNPIDKLRDEILDYPLRLWVVLENFTMYLHLKELFRLRNWLKNEGRDVEFYTLDLKNERLVPISDFAKDVLRTFRVVVD